jgi:hypothetical protein
MGIPGEAPGCGAATTGAEPGMLVVVGICGWIGAV